jgi:hypothetical protein
MAGLGGKRPFVEKHQLISGWLSILFVDGALQGRRMNVPGKMHRTFTVDRIPAGRVRRTEVLHFQADSDHGLIGRQAFDLGGCIPGGTAWRTPQHIDFLYAARF